MTERGRPRPDLHLVETAAAGGQPSEDIVVLPKSLRMEWTDALALDPRLSPTAFRVGAVIGFHLNWRRCDTFVKQETIARLMELSERTIWGAIVELERRGWLIVERRNLGITTRRERSGTITMVNSAGGRGLANRYIPAFGRSQITATNTGKKLAEYCDHYAAQRSQNRVAKVAADCELTLKSNSVGAGALAHARGEHQLGAAGDLLSKRLGEIEFRCWFKRVQFDAIEGNTLRLSVPSAAVKKWLTDHYQEAIIACWQKMQAMKIDRVEMTVPE